MLWVLCLPRQLPRARTKYAPPTGSREKPNAALAAFLKNRTELLPTRAGERKTKRPGTSSVDQRPADSSSNDTCDADGGVGQGINTTEEEANKVLAIMQKQHLRSEDDLSKVLSELG